MKLQAVFLARQAGHLRSLSLSHRDGVIDMCTMPGLCVGAVDSKSVPTIAQQQFCTLSPLLTHT